MGDGEFSVEVIGLLRLASILLFAFLVPLVWILVRGDKYTDREGREPPIPDPRLTGEEGVCDDIGMWGSGNDLEGESIGMEWLHPDIIKERKRIKLESEKLKKQRAQMN
jgi:hypothetical protein